MSVKIVHASIDERNKATGGKAGDQTGKEVCVRSWYSKPWEFMLRYPDATIAKRVVEIATKLANSGIVGYNQNRRNTLYTKLALFNWDVDRYIASGIKTETDCSAFIYACYCCAVASMRSTANAPRTATMKAAYKKFGFKVYTDSKYLTTDKNLMVGDILVKAGAHTVMVVTNGSSVNTTTDLDYSVVFDAAFYRSKYPDLAQAGIVTDQQLLQHFLNNGMKEARWAHPDFNVVRYRSAFKDLDNTFGDNWVKYYEHYIKFGRNEIKSGLRQAFM